MAKLRRPRCPSQRAQPPLQAQPPLTSDIPDSCANTPGLESCDVFKENKSTATPSHTGKKRYLCQYCGRRFARSDNLKSHKRSDIYASTATGGSPGQTVSKTTANLIIHAATTDTTYLLPDLRHLCQILKPF